jgi:hypothetical protein
MRVDPSLLLSLLVMGVSAGAVLGATAWPWKAALFPLVIGIPVFLLAAAEFCVAALGRAAPTEAQAVDFVPSTHADPALARRRAATTFGWLVAFALLIVALGFSLAIPLFVLVYLRLHAREGWARSLILSVVAWASVQGLFVRLLNLPFPEGWVQIGLRAMGLLT